MPSLYDIYACISFDHDPRMLAAAIFLCGIGATVTFALLRQIAESTELVRRRILFTLTVLSAACSVWATHFVAMLGYVRGLDRALSVSWTVFSLVLAITLYTVAASVLIRANRSLSASMIAALALTAAVTGMHYTGIQAFRESALLVWDLKYVGISIVGSLIANYAATRAFVQQRNVTAVFGAAAFFSVSIVCLHFIGMTGLTLLPFTAAEATGGSAVWLTPAIVVAVITIAFGGAVAIAFDRFAMRRQIAEAERLKLLAAELRQANEEANCANAELTRARDLAEQAARSKSRFFAMMSHEIRTPINGVLGMAEALAGMPLTTEHRECVSVIRSSGRALLSVINDILDISKLEQSPQNFARERLDLRELLEEVAALAAPLAEAKGLRLHLRYPTITSPIVAGDEGRIRQIVTNLVGNAIKFTDQGHVLIDVAERREQEGPTIRIVDTGVGIAEAQLEDIFEAFYQTQTTISGQIGGTGLGLAIGRMLARQMGGDLAVSSSPGEGSVFTFTLSAEQWVGEEETQAAPEGLGRFAVLASDPLDQKIICGMIRGACGDPILCDTPDAIEADQVVGVVVCQDGARGGPGIAKLPLLRIVAPTAFSETGAGQNETRVLRPVRHARLVAWLHSAVSTQQGANHLSIPVLEECATPVTPDGCRSDRILIVDDSSMNRLVVKRLLQSGGFEFTEAVNGKEACEISAAETFSYIFMDVSMPVMDGIVATTSIRERELRDGTPRTPIFGLTAHAFEEDRQACLKAGMDDVATKPVSKATLLSLLACCNATERPEAGQSAA